MAVFISYRQVDPAECERVRKYAERIRSQGVDVAFDYFYLDDHPEGPPEGWPKWCSDRATNSDFVLVIGSPEWFACFDGTQPPGEGLGAACEAYDLRQRIYDGGNLNATIRVVLFDDADAKTIPKKLKGYHTFRADRDFDAIIRWLKGSVPTVAVAVQPQTNGIAKPSSKRRIVYAAIGLLLILAAVGIRVFFHTTAPKLYDVTFKQFLSDFNATKNNAPLMAALQKHIGDQVKWEGVIAQADPKPDHFGYSVGLTKASQSEEWFFAGLRDTDADLSLRLGTPVRVVGIVDDINQVGAILKESKIERADDK